MGIHEIVPSTLEVDLETLSVNGRPAGTMRICSLDAEASAVRQVG
jgi:hypothetical protein